MSTTLVDMIALRKGNIEGQIKTYERYITGCRERLTKVEAEETKRFALVEKLRAAGFEPWVSEYCETVSIDVPKEKLTEVHRVVGRLKKEYANIANARRKMIEVTLIAVNEPLLRVKYVRKLTKSDPCQIISRKVKAYTERHLECHVNCFIRSGTKRSHDDATGSSAE
jgi:hypothetical protein